MKVIYERDQEARMRVLYDRDWKRVPDPNKYRFVWVRGGSWNNAAKYCGTNLHEGNLPPLAGYASQGLRPLIRIRKLG